MTRKKYTSKFKTKVVLEALRERYTVAELAQNYELAPLQIHQWKRDFLSKAEDVFYNGPKGKKSEKKEEKDQLLETIGQLKVENGFLKNALR